MRWLGSVPLLVLPVLILNGLALAGGSGGLHGTAVQAQVAGVLFSVPMHSGAPWPVTLGDLLLFVSLAILFIELLKSTTSRRVAIVNHSLSMLLFIVCLVEFLLFPAFATSCFFLIMSMVLLDVLAGFIVTLSASRREIDVVR